MRLEVQRKQFQSIVHEKSPRLAVTMIHSPEKHESLTDATADGLLTKLLTNVGSVAGFPR